MPRQAPAKDEAPFPGSDGRLWQVCRQVLRHEVTKLLVGEDVPIAILVL